VLVALDENNKLTPLEVKGLIEKQKEKVKTLNQDVIKREEKIAEQRKEIKRLNDISEMEGSMNPSQSFKKYMQLKEQNSELKKQLLKRINEIKELKDEGFMSSKS
jgi:hypothetical protein